MVSFKMAPMGKTKTSTPFSQIKEMWFFTVLLKTYKSCKSCKCLSSYPIFILCFKNSDTKEKNESANFGLDKSSWSHHLKKKKLSLQPWVFTSVFAPKKFSGTVKFVPLPVGGDTGLRLCVASGFAGRCHGIRTCLFRGHDMKPSQTMHYC